MTIDYPGSTKVTSWKRNLPEWIEIVEVAGRKTVSVEMTKDVDPMIDRYNQNRVCRAVVDSVFENNSSFDNMDFNESMEKAVVEMGYENFASGVAEVEERL